MQAPQFPLKISSSLSSHNAHLGGRDWLWKMNESTDILNGIVSIIHPDMYNMGKESMARLLDSKDFQTIAPLWNSIFNGVSVICNRETPFHRDSQSCSQWYDLLVTVGPYKGAMLELPGIGIKLSYESGTVVGIAGRLIRHGVNWVSGDRVCIAYFMRENVQERLKIPPASWNHVAYYR